MLHCYNCGADMPDNMLFCTVCGKKLDAPEAETRVLGEGAAPTVAFGGAGTRPMTQPVVAKKSGGGFKAVVITLLGLFLVGAVVVVGGALYFMLNKRQNVTVSTNVANRPINIGEVNVDVKGITDNTNAIIDNAMKQIQQAANDALAAANQASNINIPGKSLDGKTTRIEFRPGSVTGTAVGFVEEEATFVLRAKADQTISARITSPGGCIKFEDNDETTLTDGTTSGDNYITVTNSCGKRTSMVLSVTIK